MKFLNGMHAIKGDWVGQTFALAKSNESGGKKTRIRRSKEERKAMVESFIKKYQKLNNGNFPSLNFTHKECGGSFYTIREIVREVIQENRVLGPAKLTPEEQDTDQFLEQYPLGTLSTGPQSALSISSNEKQLGELLALNSDGICLEHAKLSPEEQDAAHFWEEYSLGTISAEPQPLLSISSTEYQYVPDHGQGTREEPIFNSDALCVGAEHQRLDNVQIINGSHVDTMIGESDNTTSAEYQACESKEAEKSIEPDHGPGANKEPILNSDGFCVGAEHQRLDNVQMIDGGHVDARIGESDNKTSAEYQASELKAAEGSVEDLVASTAKVTDIMTDVIVETFPVRPETKATDGLEGRSSEVGNLNVDLDEFFFEKVNLGPSNGSSLSDKVHSPDHSALVDERMKNPADLLLERESGLEDKRVVHHLADPPLESSDCTNTEEGIVNDNVKVKVSCIDIAKSYAYEQSEAFTGAKAIHAPNGSRTKSHESICPPSSSGSTTEEVTVIENQADVKRSSSSRKGSSPTLERINLESWKAASKNVAEAGHPLLAIFKSFVAAFVKFWSAE